ncbi:MULTISPECIES: DUF7312 domain-containing protein [Haloferax]|uniref:DUF7312 domain-containing protein n=3 Tax=Haloferax TaxID=2251 RepID=A0A0K1IR28_HALGI|nr:MULTISPECIES: hypothetical protein [Haloferax]AKU06916.1 hypothetical protein ABY42_03845 [Haloferax gibbonsii]ELZ73139.1 hypothetical protein C457_04231 [Haloferax prahovense DSM 18310]ELZ83360.1 hypothetical protein C454_03582 [Haloferax gibbonsii ATCC 33959]QOS10960.1 uncharacterized protein HfgLR_04080 [Haloferax gibbonsii]RDZ43540.1 hypothetical protein C5B86_10880 [Haloferax sp. Atlit-19N]
MSRAPSPEAEDDRDGDGEWRFGVDDVGPDGIVDDEPEIEQLPIEPGSPRAENVAFVFLGVLLAVGLIVITVFPGAV